MKRFIITGADGFLGNNIVRKLEGDRENEIRALILPDSDGASLAGLNCKIYRGDVTKPQTLNEIFDLPKDGNNYVIHCAAIVYIKSKYNPKMQEVNVNGTMNVAKKALETGAKMVYVSSVHAITEKPDGEVMTEIDKFEPDKVSGQYAKTKAETANKILDMVRSDGLDACIVHPSGLLGPNDYGSSHLTQLVIDCVNGKLVAGVKGGYDFADVRDVADGIISACYNGGTMLHTFKQVHRGKRVACRHYGGERQEADKAHFADVDSKADRSAFGGVLRDTQTAAAVHEVFAVHPRHKCEVFQPKGQARAWVHQPSAERDCKGHCRLA